MSTNLRNGFTMPPTLKKGEKVCTECAYQDGYSTDCFACKGTYVEKQLCEFGKTCKYGTTCRLVHLKEWDMKVLCSHFQRRTCKFPNTCKNVHMDICQAFNAGQCSLGKECPQAHVCRDSAEDCKFGVECRYIHRA